MSTLKVGTIQSTTANTAMTIDSSGRVTTPARPSFFVTGYQSSSTDFTTGGGSATINGVTPSNMELMYNYRTVHHNIGSHFSNSTGRFTCPIAGLYLVTGHNAYKATVNYFGLSLFYSSSALESYGDVMTWSHNHGNNSGHTLVAHVNASVGQEFLMAYRTGYADPSNASNLAPYVSFGVTFLG